jgi:hypothetical protein
MLQNSMTHFAVTANKTAWLRLLPDFFRIGEVLETV